MITTSNSRVCRRGVSAAGLAHETAAVTDVKVHQQNHLDHTDHNPGGSDPHSSITWSRSRWPADPPHPVKHAGQLCQHSWTHADVTDNVMMSLRCSACEGLKLVESLSGQTCVLQQHRSAAPYVTYKYSKQLKVPSAVTFYTRLHFNVTNM